MNLRTFLSKIESPSFLIIFYSILFLLVYNLFHYNPIQGYDGEAHHAYVQNFLNIYIPGKTNQPSSNFTYEFFSPPLPYIFPTFINELCKLLYLQQNKLEFCQNLYGFFSIALLSIFFVLILFIYFKIFKLLFKNKTRSNLSILLTIGIFTANYKAVSMIRGEVYILLLNSILIYRFLLLIKNSFNFKKKDIIIFGIIIGLLGMSRQWAFLLFPAFFVFYFFLEKQHKFKYLKFISCSFFIGFIVSSWFYIGLFIEYGSFTAFNQNPTKFSFSNQPLDFYIPYTREALMIFIKPIRPNFANQFLPILYSDLWGDYWGYFSFTSRDLSLGRNQAYIGNYLARVNIVSLAPSLLLLIGVRNSIKAFKNKKKDDIEYLNLYIVISILVSLLGFLWFLISFPSKSGDTNKATYIIHMFHLMGLSLAIYLEKLKRINLKIYCFFIFILFITFFHNFSAMMSHFPLVSFK